MPPRRRIRALLLACVAASAAAQVGLSPTDGGEHFRARVLPVLEARCFECHGPSAAKIRGKLRMSGRESLLAGGLSGPALVPGEPDASLLIQAVRRTDPDLAMPPKDALPPEEIALLEEWVAMGAPWPEEALDPEVAAFDREALAFFENDVRPLLDAHCFRCHGSDVAEVKSGLRMSGRAALLEGGHRGPTLVPGDPEASLLVRAVRYGDPALQMPPKGRLADEEIALLERWIALGAPWPDDAAAPVPEEREIDVANGRAWWSFRPVARPPVPAVEGAPALANAIDAFVRARLAEAGLAPNSPASDEELVRRAHFDLIGLPPTRADVLAYAADRSPDKWGRLIDRLLARPEYGERFGRHWLDVVRFAQTNGYERDSEKPYAWRYRDWVIESFNADKPFDRFLAEQLAGDELDEVTPDTLVATGFYHLGAWDSEPDDKEQAVYDGYDDVLRTIGEGMLGVTVGCARCHDHKFDPIRQSDYYGMLAFVRNVKAYIKPKFALDSEIMTPLSFTPEEAARWEEERAAHIRGIEARQAAMLAERRKQMIEEIVAAESTQVQAAYRMPPAQRGQEERRLLASLAHKNPQDAAVTAALADRERQQLFLWKEEAERSRESFEGSLDWALVAREAGPVPQATHVLGRGRVGTPLEAVEPTYVPVLCPSEDASAPSVPPRVEGAPSTGLRRALAEWIASAEHPTTARVIANRVWQHLFGRGIVRTPNDFGATGAPPTHPELLDWLASELVREGWSLKALHRLVMSSEVYRMSSRAENLSALAKDPGNDLFWRQNPQRLDAEALRDSLLAVGGRLRADERGGRGFFPAQSREALAGASKPGDGWEVSSANERERRAVYCFVKRGMLPTLFELFDFADPTLPIGARPVTTLASQALTLLNSDFSSEAARALAERVRAEAGDEPRARVTRLFELALARPPAPEELDAALAELARSSEAFASVPALLEFRSKVPPRLQTEFLAGLPDEDFFYGPRAGWKIVRGRWGGYYNDTLERDRDRGPAALLLEPHFADASIRGRVRLDEGCEVAALGLRAREIEGELAGLEVVLDPIANEARLVALAGPEGEPAVLDAIALTIEPGHWYELAIDAVGTRVAVALDGAQILAFADVPIVDAGSFAVRTFGDVLAFDALAIQLGDDVIAVEPDETVSPAERAFESLCLAVLNLDEFVVID